LNEKDLIFISHAAPESNEFATWLAARLTAAGYKVWIELRELEVGDRFWPEIEAAIRTRSAKFVTVVANNVSNKFGYRRELSLADAIERQQSPGFILPVRVDDVAHFDVPAEVHDKHVLDFSEGWHRGLAALVKRLEKDGIPHASDTEAAISNLAVLQLDEQQKTHRTIETVVSNWLTVVATPPGIKLHQFHGEPVSAQTFKGEWPARFAGDVLITFARVSDFAMAKYYSGEYATTELRVDSFLGGHCPQLPNLTAADRRSIYIDLLRQAWERHMTVRGLSAYELSNKRLAWYLPWKLSAGRQLPLVNAAGTPGRRALSGESAKLKCRWHFAVAPNVQLWPQPKVALNYTVVFTKDGTEPLEDKAKAHRFRRSFCKSWWQDRWRDMLYAYLSFVKGRDAALTLLLSPDRKLEFSPQLSTFIAPVSALEPIRSEQLSDELVDSLSGEESDFDPEATLDANYDGDGESFTEEKTQ
jgi:hypothetical protein